MRISRIVMYAVLLGTFVTTASAQAGSPKTPEEWLKLRTQFIAENPGDEMWYSQRASTHVQMNNLAEAIKDLDRAIELNPNYGGAYYDRALIMLKQGRKAEAIEELIVSATIDMGERNQDYPPEAFKKIIELNPKDFRGHRGLGYTKLFAAEQWPFYDEAIEHFNTALKLKPKDVDTLKWRGTAYIRTEKFALAAADLSQAILLKPSEALYTLRAEAYEGLAKPVLATADKKKALALSPEPAMQRGAAARISGNMELAIQEYTKAIQLGSTKAFRERGKIYSRLKKLDLALADFKDARIWNYDDFDVELGRGEIYASQGEYEKALSAYNRVSGNSEDKSGYLFALDKRVEIFLASPFYSKHAIKDMRLRWQILCEQGNKAAAEAERKRLIGIGFKNAPVCS